YLPVRKKITGHPEFDEPVDIMLYMIISALGFAALENLLILLPLAHPFQFMETFIVSGFRFAGATFLHALTSGLLGYFLAISCFKPKNRAKLLTKGLLIATALHGLYNFSIIEIDNGFRFLVPVIILMGLLIFVSLGFKRVKNLKSICLPTGDK
ncbi:MAG: PrsW family glutamic-type intramembrane protease, partial [bacterium]|nr:PrsW family glutamic-type intramembrane protease [bacterium]